MILSERSFQLLFLIVIESVCIFLVVYCEKILLYAVILRFQRPFLRLSCNLGTSLAEKVPLRRAQA